MYISDKGIDLIKNFEGFSSVAYLCPAGKTTIGYGHTFKIASQIQTCITELGAEDLLKSDLTSLETYIKSVIRVNLTQGQYDAICSLIFNWGGRSFGKSKGLRELNKGNYSKASIEFFSKDRGVVNIQGRFSKGLYRRREAELRLWNDKA